MLKRNKNIDIGLVNGSVGTVISFGTTDTGNESRVTTINIHFDKIDGPVSIDRDSSSFAVLKSIYFTRQQFPLMTAYAITIHKSQGLSYAQQLLTLVLQRSHTV